MKYFSTFSGIGGFELGIEQAFWEDRYGKIKTECVGFSEIDKYAVQVYEKHFNHKNYGDITKISTDALPDFDLICGGFPCQSFSIAGKRGGFDDTRGTLFFELARIVRAKRPRLLFFENVKGLLSHDGGRTFDTIIRTLDELGYDCQWQVLNSKNFGVPQNRERVFIIGHLRGTSRPKVFPLRQDSEADIVLPTLTARYWGGQANGGYIGKKQKQGMKELTKNQSQGHRVYDLDGIAQTISSGGGGLGAKTGLYAIGSTQKNAARMENRSPALTEAMGKGGGQVPMVTAVPLKFLERNQKNYQGEYSFTLDSAQTGGIMQDMKIRRLTPTECERLQGFPDGWTAGISDSQRYKCLGNAVTVNVIREIVKKMI